MHRFHSRSRRSMTLPLVSNGNSQLGELKVPSATGAQKRRCVISQEMSSVTTSDMILLRIRIPYRIDVSLSGGSVPFVSYGYCPSSLEQQQDPIRVWMVTVMMTSTPRNSSRCLLLQR